VSERELRLCVAVPTRSRCDLLLRALEAVGPQLRAGDELIVVDNGSSDATAVSARAWLGKRFPSGRLVTETVGGLSVARNRALAEATSSVVCFVDDDVRPDPGWLAALRQAWLQAGANVAGVGGPMRPDWGAPRPAWLADHLLYVLALLDLGDEPKRLDQAPAVGYIWGGNMSFRKDAVRSAGGFDPDSGARPAAPYDRGEEEKLQRRLARSGWEIWYEPVASVRHFVPAERTTRAYFRTVFAARAFNEAARGVPRRAGVPRLARGAAAYLLARLRRSPNSEAARLVLVHGWTLLTARRPA
jgi:glucosyl-dolichyl phosphate glucuronosyltransferase